MSSSPLLSSSVSQQGNLNSKLLVISYQIRDPMSAENTWFETEMDFYGLLNIIFVSRNCGLSIRYLYHEPRTLSI